MTKEIIAQGSIPEFEHDGDDIDRYYMPTRALGFGVNRKDCMVVLPETPETVQYYDQLSTIVGQLEMSLPQAAMIPDTNYFLDIAIMQHRETLQRHLVKEEPYVVRPYANSTHLRSWMSVFQQEGYNIETRMPERVYFDNLKHPQHRGGWARWVDSPEELSFPEKYDIAYPIAYIGLGRHQVKEAYERVIDKAGNPNVYFKPVFSAGGFTISKVDSVEQVVACFDQLETEGGLHLFGREMPIEMQAEVQNVIGFASIQYNNDGLTTPGGVSIQIVDGYGWGGNEFNTEMTRRVEDKTSGIYTRFITGYRQEVGVDKVGFGGLDIPIISVGADLDVCVLEHNGARVVGADPGIHLAQSLDVSDRPFLVRKTSDPNSDLHTLWEMLKSDGLAYDQFTKRGVFPLLWVEGSGFLFTTGEEEEIHDMTSRALELTSQNGYVK